MIASGSSERGLSEVTITRSASRAAISPISGRLPRSRSPPAPNTQITRPPPDPASRQLAGRAQHVLERVGRVGVVDEHGEVLALVDRLEAARDAHAALERRDERVELDAERVRGGERAERVGDVEAARQRQRELALARGRAQREAAAVEAAAQLGSRCSRPARRRANVTHALRSRRRAGGRRGRRR